MNNYLILGSNGLLGSSISPILSLYHESVIHHTRLGNENLSADLRSAPEVDNLFTNSMPKIVLNLAALADVDMCEDPNLAYLGNVKPLENIVNSIKLISPSSFLINISTDHVYDNVGISLEKDIQILNYYAFSKFSGELVVNQIEGCSLRTNFFGKSKIKEKLSFTDWLFQKLMDDDNINVFKDVFFNPLSMTTLANYINKISDLKPQGVFNLGSRLGLSKAEFANIFAEELKIPTSKIKSVNLNQVEHIKTIRPKDMRMDVGKVESLLQDKMPILVDEIKLSVEEYYSDL